MAISRRSTVGVILCGFAILSMVLIWNIETTRMTCTAVGDRKIYQTECIVEAKEVRMKQRINTSQFLGTGYFPPFLNSLSLLEAQMLLYGNIRSVGFKCQNRKRFGNVGDGGYEVCMDEPLVPRKNNCLVYSFGIRNEWSFDEAINKYFRCDVHSFDPSMGLQDHVHKEPNMFFYNLGIWGSNFRNADKWELRDLATIVKRLKHGDRIIDYLKIDVEGAEWPVITHLIKSDIYKQIKQMALELHTPRFRRDRMTVTDYAEIIYGLKELERLGFKKFYTRSINSCCGGFDDLTPASIAGTRKCCYETFYVNTQFL